MFADNLAAWIAFAYLVAAIPVGFIVGKLNGVDLRTVGSGNIGASNAMRTLGKKQGLLVFLLDVTKAALPIWLARRSSLGDDPLAVAYVGGAAVVGHIYPVYLRFKGGKGVACALGVFLVLSPVTAAVAFAIYVGLLVVTKVSAIGSLAAVTVGAAMVFAIDPEPAHRGLIISVAVLIWWRHRSNLRALLAARGGKRESA